MMGVLECGDEHVYELQLQRERRRRCGILSAAHLLVAVVMGVGTHSLARPRCFLPLILFPFLVR